MTVPDPKPLRAAAGLEDRRLLVLREGVRRALGDAHSLVGFVRTPEPRWAYARVAQLERRRSAPRNAALAACVEATVSSGCIGIGVLTPNDQSFVTEAQVTRLGTSESIDVLFETTGRPHRLVVRNCSDAGASAVTIHAATLLPVTQISMKRIDLRREQRVSPE